MKKRVILIFSLLILISIAGAQEGFEDFKEDIKGLEDTKDTLTDRDAREEYLRGKWDETLNKTALGGFFTTTDRVIEKADPILEILLGSPFAWSWFFILTLVIYLLSLKWSWDLLTIIEPYFRPIDKAKYVKWGIFAVFFIVISSVRIPKWISELIIGQIAKFEDIKIQIMFIIIIIFVLIIITLFFIYWKRSFKEEKKEQRVKTTEKKLKKQRKELDKIEKELAGSKDELSEREKRELQESAREDVEGLGEV